ncbi:hypothetical protein HK096_002366, partial [Nowakowskiella sp. JEL0078]
YLHGRQTHCREEAAAEAAVPPRLAGRASRVPQAEPNPDAGHVPVPDKPLARLCADPPAVLCSRFLDTHRSPSAQLQPDNLSRFYSQQQPNSSTSSFYESDSFSHVAERDLDSRNTNRHSMSDTVSINSISAPLGVAEGRSLFFSAKEPKNEMLLLTSSYRPHFNEEKDGRLGTGPPPEFAKLPEEADYVVTLSSVSQIANLNVKDTLFNNRSKKTESTLAIVPESPSNIPSRSVTPSSLLVNSNFSIQNLSHDQLDRPSSRTAERPSSRSRKSVSLDSFKEPKVIPFHQISNQPLPQQNLQQIFSQQNLQNLRNAQIVNLPLPSKINPSLQMQNERSLPINMDSTRNMADFEDTNMIPINLKKSPSAGRRKLFGWKSKELIQDPEPIAEKSSKLKNEKKSNSAPMNDANESKSRFSSLGRKKKKDASITPGTSYDSMSDRDPLKTPDTSVSGGSSLSRSGSQRNYHLQLLPPPSLQDYVLQKQKSHQLLVSQFQKLSALQPEDREDWIDVDEALTPYYNHTDQKMGMLPRGPPPGLRGDSLERKREYEKTEELSGFQVVGLDTLSTSNQVDHIHSYDRTNTRGESTTSATRQLLVQSNGSQKSRVLFRRSTASNDSHSSIDSHESARWSVYSSSLDRMNDQPSSNSNIDTSDPSIQLQQFSPSILVPLKRASRTSSTKKRFSEVLNLKSRARLSNQTDSIEIFENSYTPSPDISLEFEEVEVEASPHSRITSLEDFVTRNSFQDGLVSSDMEFGPKTFNVSPKRLDVSQKQVNLGPKQDSFQRKDQVTRKSMENMNPLPTTIEKPTSSWSQDGSAVNGSLMQSSHDIPPLDTLSPQNKYTQQPTSNRPRYRNASVGNPSSTSDTLNALGSFIDGDTSDTFSHHRNSSVSSVKSRQVPTKQSSPVPTNADWQYTIPKRSASLSRKVSQGFRAALVSQTSIPRGQLPVSPVSPVTPPVPTVSEYIMKTQRTQHNIETAVPSMERVNSNERSEFQDRRSSDPHGSSLNNTKSFTAESGASGLATVWNGWKQFDPPIPVSIQQQLEKPTSLSRVSSRHRRAVSNEDTTKTNNKDWTASYQRQNSIASTSERLFQSAKIKLDKVVSPDNEEYISTKRSGGDNSDERRLTSSVDWGYWKIKEAERRIVSPGSEETPQRVENVLSSWKLEMPSLIDMMGSEFGELFQKER